MDRDILLAAVTSALRRPARAHTGGPASSVVGTVPVPSHADILLVGPDVTTLSAVKVALSPAACKVAGSLQAALHYLEDLTPVLVLFDESTRREDVVTVAREVRRMVPGCKLALLNGAHGEILSRTLDRAGIEFETFINRPYGLNDVRSLLRVALAGRPGVAIRTGRITAPVLRAIEHVCRHYSTATITSIAQAARVSAGHLGHVFPAETGMTVWECVTAVRLEVAKDLLRETSYKLEYIAHLTGFSDAPHLSRVFSQNYGCSARCSPRGFRNRALRKVG